MIRKTLIETLRKQVDEIASLTIKFVGIEYNGLYANKERDLREIQIRIFSKQAAMYAVILQLIEDLEIDSNAR